MGCPRQIRSEPKAEVTSVIAETGHCVVKRCRRVGAKAHSTKMRNCFRWGIVTNMMKRPSASEYVEGILKQAGQEQSSLGPHAEPSFKKLKLHSFAPLSPDKAPQTAFGCGRWDASSIVSLPCEQPAPNISTNVLSHADPQAQHFQSTGSLDNLAHSAQALAFPTVQLVARQCDPSQISSSFIPHEFLLPSQYLMGQNQLQIYQLHQLTQSATSALWSNMPSVRNLHAPAPQAAPVLHASVGSHRVAETTQSVRKVPVAHTIRGSRKSQARLMLKLGVAAMMPDEEAPCVQLPAVIGCRTDSMVLSEHQVLLRQQIEVFQTTEHDVSTHARGRNKPICLGQVGIRCRHCAHVPVSHRQQGAAYFPATILGLYQAAQNMSTNHIQCGMCHYMPQSMKDQFKELIPTKKHHSGVGREYWAATAKRLGLVDTDMGIGFRSSLPMGATIIEVETPKKEAR